MLPLTRHLPPSWILSVVRADLLRGYADHDRGSHDIDLYLRPFGASDGRDALMAHLHALDAAETITLAPRLGTIVSPTAIVWGKDDPFLDVATGERLNAAIPKSTLDVIAEGRHFTPVESAHRVADAISGLLAR